ncbi:MAG: NAD(P)/FAD-dependent oxidoreductase [Chitinophagaceae bacterium]|nr:NAD(P)/FAD-dependent oxidoreductase [Chitinophagaceae bacterium]MCW5925356.1 NAD(P)/FAD-dependent oxidoreductase [Chitinophagaceae bacterium]
MKPKHLVVTGGGAAGFFTAVNAARLNPDLRVTILEKTGKLLSKVRVSGGGRCNVTHACFSIPDMVLNYPRGANFLKKAFHHFFTTDTIQWFEERGVQLKTEADGRMFPVSNSSQSIIDCLMREAEKYSVIIHTNTAVKAIVPGENSYKIQLDNEKLMTADYICVACGGFPKPEQFAWLTRLGHTISTPVPSLFTFNMPDQKNAKNSLTTLMGISVPSAVVKVTSTKLVSTGSLLITHWGLSGPVILKLSAWGARELAEKNYHFDILVNWIPEYTEHSLRAGWQEIRQQHSGKKVSSGNPFGLPARLWEYLLAEANISPDQRWDDLKALQQNGLIQKLTGQSFEIKGKTTFKEEFVTAGGISLKEIDVNTMQSKIHPGLFFAGEIMDVDGITGGFNFQHAWTSGWIAAKGIADCVI